MATTAPDLILDIPAPAFTLPATDGRTYTLDDIAGANGAMILVICNHCSHVKAIIDRLVADARGVGGRVIRQKIKLRWALAVCMMSGCAGNQSMMRRGERATDRHIVPGPSMCGGARADKVFFDFDSATLSDGARTTLDKQAAWLATYPRVYALVTGNADERGTEEYDLALGMRRASAAREYLVAKGLAPDRIRITSYGKELPIDARHTEAAWSINRNATTSVSIERPSGQRVEAPNH
jgi:peptidoglycan-associated lipoprotein